MKLFVRFIRIKVKHFSIILIENLDIIANLIILMGMYIMLYLGAVLYHERQYFAVGGEFVIPIALIILSIFIRFMSNNNITGSTTIPIPRKRFTKSTLDEVIIDNNRVEEMLVYLNDLEDWMETNGFIETKEEIIDKEKLDKNI